MAGIGGLMGALGAVNGLAKGYMQGQDQARQQRNEDEDRAFKRDIQDRQRRVWADEDQSKDHLAESNRAAQQAYEQAIGPDGIGQYAQPRTAQESVQQPEEMPAQSSAPGGIGMSAPAPATGGIGASLSIGGGADAGGFQAPKNGLSAAAAQTWARQKPQTAPATAQQQGPSGEQERGSGPARSAGIASAPAAPAEPSWDKRGRAVVKALEAKSEYLLKNAGPGEAWASAWGTAAKARDAIRAESMDRGEAEYRRTGDASALIKATYPYLDDGYDLVDAATITGKDGKTAIRMTRVSRDTGKEESQDMAADQVVTAFHFLRDPAAARRLEFEATMARTKTDRDLYNQLFLVNAKAEAEARARGLNGPKYGQPQIAVNPETGEEEFVRFSDRPDAQPQFTGVKPRPAKQKEPAAEKPLTEAQGVSTSLFLRAQNALGELGGTNLSTKDYLLQKVPGGNYLTSEDGQKAITAEKQFISAVLRKESGAAISQGEYDSYGQQFFPRPGDSAERLKQKEQSRQVALEGLRVQAGPGIERVRATSGKPGGASGSWADAPGAGVTKTIGGKTYRSLGNGEWEAL